VKISKNTMFFEFHRTQTALVTDIIFHQKYHQRWYFKEFDSEFCSGTWLCLPQGGL